ncbi:hypothetical protein IAT40_000153 [Kwoniella sp. CBS 6097]
MFPSIFNPSPAALTFLFFVTFSVKKCVAVRQITINNKCPAPIYLSIGSPTGGALGADGSPQPGSWMQEVGEYGFTVPDDWKDARIWAQTGCEGTNCKIGNCGGGVCDGNQYGTPGATLAEFGFGGYGGQDYYDISMVDGYNLPMQIDVQGCPTASCGVQQDILEVCDPSLVYPKGSGKVYSCGSPCIAGVQFQQGTSGPLITAEMADTPVCCQHAGVGVNPVDCPNTYIPFYKKMKELCHDGYLYPKDDMYPGSILACPSASQAAYTVTFCPNGVGAALNPPDVGSCSPMDSTPGDNAGNHEGGGATSPIWGETLKGEIIPGTGTGSGTGTGTGSGGGGGNSTSSVIGGASSTAPSQPPPAGSTGVGISSAGSAVHVPPHSAITISIPAGSGVPPPPPLSPNSAASGFPLPPLSSTSVSAPLPPGSTPPAPISSAPPLAGSPSSSGPGLFIPGVSSIPSEPNGSPVAGPPAASPSSSSSLTGPLGLIGTSTSTSLSSGSDCVEPSAPPAGSDRPGGGKWGRWGARNGIIRRGGQQLDEKSLATAGLNHNERLGVLARHRDRSTRRRRTRD